MNELFRRCSVGGHDPAQRAVQPQVAHERPRIDIPNHGNLVSVQIELRRFGRAPVRRHLRKFAHDERLDVGLRRFLIVEISSDISDVRIRQADDLPGVTWVGENFLVSGEAGIKNDFAAPARDRAGRTAVKYAPVFQRENGRSVLNLVQCVLRRNSFRFRFRRRCRRQRAKVIHGPIRKNSASIDEVTWHCTKNT